MYRGLNRILLRSQAILLLLLIHCLLPAVLNAQWHNLGQYESPEALIGLSSQSVTTMMQDSRGFIWIGTTVGLNRFDGRHVKQYLNVPSDENSISGNWIYSEALFEHAGYIWVGSRNGALNRYDPRTDKFEQVVFRDSTSTPVCSHDVSAITATDENTLWLGTYEGLCKVDLSDFSAKHYSSDPAASNSLSSNFISDLSVDEENRLWIATFGGLNLYQPDNDNFKRYLVSSELDQPEIPNTFKRALTDGEHIWLITRNGELYRFHWPTRQVTPIPILNFDNDIRVEDLFFEADGTIWVGIFNGGLCRFDENQDVLTCDSYSESDPKSLVDNQVTSIIKDYEGHLWIGTWRGVSKRNQYTNVDNLVYSRSTPSNSLSAPLVKTIYEDDDGKVWIGTIDGGIDVFDLTTQTLRNLNTGDAGTALHNKKVWNITETEDIIWIGTEYGVSKYNKELNTFLNFPFIPGGSLGIQSPYIYKIFIDQQKRRWVGTATAGLYQFEHGSDVPAMQFTAGSGGDSLLSNDIWPIFQDKKGTLWFGSYSSGLYQFNETDSTFINYQPTEKPGGISNANVVNITGDLHDNLWISTTTGLNYFDKSTGKFSVYTTADGLPHNVVNCTIVDAKNRVWIGTNAGLSVYDPKTSSFTNFHEQNGITNETFEPNACHKGKSGRLYFGTRNGLISFFPDEVKLNEMSPKIAVAGLEVNSEPAELNSESEPQRFTYQQNSLRFHIALNTFGNPQENRLKYRLLGQSDAWFDNGTNDEINFTFLPPNEYVLEVIGINSFGIESVAPLRVAFEIQPPYWQTWWFRGLMFGLALCIGFGLYRARVRTLLAIEKAKFQAEAKAKEEMDILRHRIAADFHDGLGSNIASLGLQMDLTANDAKTPAPIQEKLNNYISRLDDISQFRRDMTWVVDSGNDTLAQLLERITEMAFKMVPSGQLSIEIPSAVPNINLSMDSRQHLLFLTQEALHNAVKHAAADNIWLKITEENDAYTFLVKDDGIGFDPSKIRIGGGMRNMPERASSIGADFSINHPQQGGTEIILKIKFATSEASKMED